jgi:hypothetical protein
MKLSAERLIVLIGAEPRSPVHVFGPLPHRMQRIKGGSFAGTGDCAWLRQCRKRHACWVQSSSCVRGPSYGPNLTSGMALAGIAFGGLPRAMHICAGSSPKTGTTVFTLTAVRVLLFAMHCQPTLQQRSATARDCRLATCRSVQ